jgi:undecaprenyl-diphosphatase
MPLYQVVILAIVQGLTEFLPISSSAHLALAPWFLGWNDQGLTFDIALHFGTLAAVLMYFFRDWVQLTAQAFGFEWGRDAELKKNPRMFWMLAAGSIPIGVLGYLFKDLAENSWRENHILIGGMLIGVGVLMAIGEKVGRRVKDIGAMSWSDCLLVGVAQALAIVPGTSRSGITIPAGLFRHMDRAAAARFSFLLSTPAIAAAALKAFWDAYKSGAHIEIASFLIGMSVSAVTGCVVIAFLLDFLRRRSLKFFVYYRIAFGIIVIALAVFAHR